MNNWISSGYIADQKIQNKFLLNHVQFFEKLKDGAFCFISCFIRNCLQACGSTKECYTLIIWQNSFLRIIKVGGSDSFHTLSILGLQTVDYIYCSVDGSMILGVPWSELENVNALPSEPFILISQPFMPIHLCIFLMVDASNCKI